MEAENVESVRLATDAASRAGQAETDQAQRRRLRNELDITAVQEKPREPSIWLTPVTVLMIFELRRIGIGDRDQIAEAVGWMLIKLLRTVENANVDTPVRGLIGVHVVVRRPFGIQPVLGGNRT